MLHVYVTPRPRHILRHNKQKHTHTHTQAVFLHSSSTLPRNISIAYFNNLHTALFEIGARANICGQSVLFYYFFLFVVSFERDAYSKSESESLVALLVNDKIRLRLLSWMDRWRLSIAGSVRF